MQNMFFLMFHKKFVTNILCIVLNKLEKYAVVSRIRMQKFQIRHLAVHIVPDLVNLWYFSELLFALPLFTLSLTRYPSILVQIPSTRPTCRAVTGPRRRYSCSRSSTTGRTLTHPTPRSRGSRLRRTRHLRHHPSS